MFIGIINSREIDRNIRRMKSALRPYGVETRARLSFRTDKKNYYKRPADYNVYYSKKLGIWWHLGDTHNRYWNSFGVDNPIKKKDLDIAVEINIPFEGKNFRVSGLWAKDKNGNIFLMHDGGIGGGKKGIGQTLFKSYYSNNFEEVSVNGFIREYYLIAQLNSKLFPYQLARFIQSIKEIKENVKKIKKVRNEKIINFNPEFYGMKNYHMSDTIISNCNHGLVVNALKNNLSGIEINNNRYMDLFSVSGNKVTRIFEVKTGLSRQSVYTAIGQLLLNSVSFKNNPELVFVCPQEIDNALITDLNKFNIKVLKYKWKNKKPVFTNLKIIN